MASALSALREEVAALRRQQNSPPPPEITGPQTPRRDPMLSGTMPDKVVLSEDEMAPAIDKLFKRLNVHESVAIQDNQPRSLMAGDESLPDAITRMKKEMVSSKETLLRYLDTLTDKIDWRLPSNLKERVAAGLLVLMHRDFDK